MDSTFYTNLPASTPTNSSALLMEAMTEVSFRLNWKCHFAKTYGNLICQDSLQEAQLLFHISEMLFAIIFPLSLPLLSINTNRRDHLLASHMKETQMMIWFI